MANARIIDGKAVSDARRARLAEKVQALAARSIAPCLVAITARADHGWSVYLRNQATACAAVGIRHRIVELPAGATQEDLGEAIEALNLDPLVHGIILQSPLPKELSDLQAQAQLSPDKDVEGVNPANLGLLLAGRQALAPCTALSAFTLAQEGLGRADLAGIEACVVGASVIVGKPIAQLLLGAGATVTTCHIHTRDLKAHTRAADLVVVAVGKAGLITAEHIKPGAVVIDVGINRIAGKDGKSETVGDVAADVSAVALAITPVPGGVGSLTTTILLESTVAAAERLSSSMPAFDAASIARVIGPAAEGLPRGAAERIAMLLSRHLVAVPGSQPLRSPLERRLAQGVLVLDGATGSELIARGIPASAIARANVDHPDLVLAVHRAYVDAGAEAITANTFGANRWRLPGGREEAVRLASAGIQLARQAALAAGGRAVFVLGSIGPLGRVVGADITAAEAEEAFAEVALAMADANADGFALETMPSTTEAAAALAAVRRVSRLPVFACRSIERADPIELGEFARAMESGGAAAVGVNCAGGPRALAPVVAELARLTRLPVVARPNAGFPTTEAGRLRYHLRPDYLVERVREYLASGVAVVGGCCGVGPEHIRAVSGAFAGKPVAKAAPAPAIVAVVPAPLAIQPLLAKVARGGFPVIAMLPGRLAPGEAVAAASRLAAAGADAVGLLGGWPGSPRGARLGALLRHLQDASGRPGVLEFIAGDTTLAQAQDAALTSHLLGLRLALIDSGVFSGTSRADTQSPGADPASLVRALKRLNGGRDLAGSRLDEATAFAVGVRVREGDAGRIDEYVAAGADFLTIQPIYEPARFRAFMAATATKTPLFAEVLLLPDAATADELDNELPALSVPERLKQRLRTDTSEDVKGVLRFLAAWKDRLAGLVVMAADERTAAAEQVIRSVSARG